MPESPEQIELVRVSKIHFLVHPGCTSNAWRYAGEVSQEADLMLDKYISAVKAIPENELLVIVTDSSKSNFSRDLKNKDLIYLRKIKEIKDILKERAIVISTEESLSDSAFEHITQIARTRGFLIDNEVNSVAYGELLQACVDEIAEEFNEQGNLSKPTLILRELTDDPDSDVSPDDRYSRIKYN